MRWAKLAKVFRPALGFLLVFAFWWILATSAWADMPPRTLWLADPVDVIKRIASFSTEEWQSVLATLQRIGIGFCLVLILGVPIGLALGYSARVYRIFAGPVDFWRSIPPIAVLPLFFFVFPKGDWARISLVVFGCLPILFTQIADAFASIPTERRELLDQGGASLLFKQRWLYLYELLPAVFTGARIVISFSVIIVVASEMAWGAGIGLGDRINNTRFAYDTAGGYAFALVAGTFGFFVNTLIRMLERKIFFWNPTTGR